MQRIYDRAKFDRGMWFYAAKEIYTSTNLSNQKGCNDWVVQYYMRIQTKHLNDTRWLKSYVTNIIIWMVTAKSFTNNKAVKGDIIISYYLYTLWDCTSNLCKYIRERS